MVLSSTPSAFRLVASPRRKASQPCQWGRELSRLNSWPSITAINRAHERQEATGDFGKDMTALIDSWQVVQDESVDFQGN